MIDRHNGEPSGESQHSSEEGESGRSSFEVARAHMAHTAFADAQEMQYEQTPIFDQQDVLSSPVLTYGTLTPERIEEIPDVLVVDIEDLHVPERVTDDDFMRPPRYRARRVRDEEDVDEPVQIVPVIRSKAMLRERLESRQAGRWDDMQGIARHAGVPLAIVERFIAKHRPKLGTMFTASELRRRVADGMTTEKMTEHFSPQFVEWAVASLRAALARYTAEQATRQIDEQLSSE